MQFVKENVQEGNIWMKDNGTDNHGYIRLTGIQILFAAAGLFLFAIGVLALKQRGGNLVPIAVYLGIAMLFAGCVNILIYHQNQKTIHGVHWLLAEGMSTAALSLFLLFNQMIHPLIIPSFLGVWELFSGILKVIDSKELKEEKIHGWLWLSMIGGIELLSGIASLLKPVDDFIGINAVVATIFFVQSSSYLLKILIYPYLVKDHEQSSLQVSVSKKG